MGALSANSLFHFTRTRENLISILQNGFYPRYCLEDPFCLGENSFVFPIVCFCDIPLSQIQNHAYTYGGYALGLTKEWAMKSGICPILYTHLTSSFHKNLLKYSDFLNDFCMADNIIENNNLVKIYSYLYSTILYMKPYEVFKNGHLVRYYDEREWRYSFDMAENLFLDFFLNPNDFMDLEKRDAANNKMIKNKLNFEPKDINYIIVTTDSEVLQIMDEVKKIKGNFPYDDVRLLTTRIVSMERIKEDF